MTLHLHRAASADLLAGGLAELLATPLDDPFEEEVVLVPAKGVERWLGQRLSHRLGAGPRGDGVCAGVRFLNPHALVSMLLGREDDDPWHPDRLVWPLLEVIDESLGEPWAAALSRHLGHDRDDDDLDRNRRWSVAHRLAGLFAQYAVQRPALVTHWREGLQTDGAGGELDPDLSWQPELWRRLVHRVGEAPPDVRHAETLDRLRAGGDGLPLPGRLSLFGHTRMPVTEVALLDALAELRDVHLWLPQASPALFDELATLVASGPVPRGDDTSHELVGHPLLASLGRDARELQRALTPVVDQTTLIPTPPTPASPSLLHWLQADLRANRQPAAVERAPRRLAGDDRSVQVHACHGLSRQVDVLREVLVGLLQDDPTLEPRDILVLCPDIETAAPLIQAGFGLADVVGAGGHPAHHLRVRLADRALSATNPLLGLAVELVDLAGGRVAASEVLDLLGRAPVRLRFRFDDDELSRLARWVAESGVRWGLDHQHRTPFAMQRFDDNTWQRGLDRVLLGAAMSGDDHRHLGGALPVDDVGSSDVDLAGRLAEAVGRLTTCLDALAEASGIAEWMQAVSTGVRSLADVAPDDAWQVPQFERELARASRSARGAGGDTRLRLADVRALLASRLAGRPTRANFRTGTLTVCTMVPMRSVPHRVVCLLGVDDGVFPRQLHVDGDDVLARRPLTGERDVRSEDRQLLLDAVMSAGETLVVCFTGADEHTGAARPPAVPLGELLDAVDRTCADPVHDRVLVRHPLQPHDVRNHVPGALGTPIPFSFDAAALAGARAGVGPRHVPPALIPGPLPTAPRGDLNLADLKAFFLHPARAFCRDRLQIGVPLEREETQDAIPIDLGGLDRWSIGDRVLREVLAGHDHVAVLTAEQLRGSLPPGRIGHDALAAIATEAQDLFNHTSALREGTPRSVDLTVDLGDGRVLTGTVSGVFGNRLVTLGYSSLGAKQRLAAWIDLLALSVARPDESWTSHAVGKARAGPTRALAGPLDHRSRQWLLDLVELRDRGLDAPLAAPVKTACAWAEGRVRELWGQNVDPALRAAREWSTDRNNPFGIPGEDADAWHQRVWGVDAPLDRLMDAGLTDAAWTIWGPLVEGSERLGPL